MVRTESGLLLVGEALLGFCVSLKSLVCTGSFPLPLNVGNSGFLPSSQALAQLGASAATFQSVRLELAVFAPGHSVSGPLLPPQGFSKPGLPFSLFGPSRCEASALAPDAAHAETLPSLRSLA